MTNLFYGLFDLNTDQESPEIIDENIRANVKVVGTNLWVLIFAILMASVGLNVNSTAVIIGAMLISPLMGPIVGVGYGTGINDFELIKLSMRNLAIFTFISVLASTLYFTISPLNTATSEILARTSPNLWDVLIAFFGGSAGIIAITRKSISNVVPGVAIGTALMPPLCTAGYGIAQGNWEFFGGAFFLYCINSVFIAFSALIFVKLFKLPKHRNLDETTTKRTNLLVGMTVFLMIVPSAYLAYNLVQQNKFTSVANEVISTFSKDPTYILLGQDIDRVNREIILTVGGDDLPDSLARSIESRLEVRGIEGASVIVRHSGSGKVDLTSLKSELQQDLYNNLQEQVNTLSERNAELEARVLVNDTEKQDIQRLILEIKAQYPQVYEINVTKGESAQIYVPSLSDASLTGDANSNNNSSNNEVADNNHSNSSNTITDSSNPPDPQSNSTQVQNATQVQDSTSTDSVKSETVRLVLLKVGDLAAANRLRIKNWLTARFKEKVVVEFVPYALEQVDNLEATDGDLVLSE